MITITIHDMKNDDHASCERILRYAHAFLQNTFFTSTFDAGKLTLHAYDDTSMHATLIELREVVASFVANDDQQSIAHECILALMTFINR